MTFILFVIIVVMLGGIGKGGSNVDASMDSCELGWVFLCVENYWDYFGDDGSCCR